MVFFSHLWPFLKKTRGTQRLAGVQSFVVPMVSERINRLLIDPKRSDGRFTLTAPLHRSFSTAALRPPDELTAPFFCPNRPRI